MDLNFIKEEIKKNFPSLDLKVKCNNSEAFSRKLYNIKNSTYSACNSDIKTIDEPIRNNLELEVTVRLELYVTKETGHAPHVSKTSYTSRSGPYSVTTNVTTYSSGEIMVNVSHWTAFIQSIELPRTKTMINRIVTGVTSGGITVNMGEKDGIKRGDKLEVVKKGLVIAKAEVESVERSSSRARITELKGQNLTSGMYVRMAEIMALSDLTRAWDIAQIKFSLKKNIESAHKKDNFGRTPLHWAAYYGEEDIVEFLLSMGVDVNEKDSEGITPLGYAKLKGYAKIADLLIEKGAKEK